MTLQVHLRSLIAWFTFGSHRLRFTPVITTLIVIASVSWQLQGFPHDLVKTFCGYHATELTSWKALRMLGGAFLIPNSDFYFGLPGLLLAMIPLERRLGFRIVCAVTFGTNVLSTIVAGIFVRAAHAQRMLHQLDVGSSVLMVSAAAMLGTYTRNIAVCIIVLGGFSIDLVLSHDLASSEHFLAITCGSTAGYVLRHRRGPAYRHVHKNL